MIAGRVDGKDTIDTRRKTLGNIGGQDTVLSNTVETLEEIEDLWIQGLGRVERLHFLYSNVTVTLNDTVDQLLRGGIVSVGRVCERSGAQVADFEGDGERGIGSEGTKVLGEGELGGRHVIDGGNITHGDGVARTCLDLLAIGNSLSDTEADEVVRTNEGVLLTGCLSFTIDLLDDGRIQCKASRGIASAGVGRRKRS